MPRIGFYYLFIISAANAMQPSKPRRAQLQTRTPIRWCWALCCPRWAAWPRAWQTGTKRTLARSASLIYSAVRPYFNLCGCMFVRLHLKRAAFFSTVRTNPPVWLLTVSVFWLYATLVDYFGRNECKVWQPNLLELCRFSPLTPPARFALAALSDLSMLSGSSLVH